MRALGWTSVKLSGCSCTLRRAASAGAAVRLGLIGAYDAQELQTALAPQLERLVNRFGISTRWRFRWRRR
jgi:hypothetical protein